METKSKQILTTSQCDDLSILHNDAKTDTINTLDDMYRSLINELDSASRKWCITLMIASVVQILAAIGAAIVIICAATVN